MHLERRSGASQVSNVAWLSWLFFFFEPLLPSSSFSIYVLMNLLTKFVEPNEVTIFNFLFTFADEKHQFDPSDVTEWVTDGFMSGSCNSFAYTCIINNLFVIVYTAHRSWRKQRRQKLQFHRTRCTRAQTRTRTDFRETLSSVLCQTITTGWVQLH